MGRPFVLPRRQQRWESPRKRCQRRYDESIQDYRRGDRLQNFPRWLLLSSVVAEEYLGYAPDTVAFALTTGLGDGIGVMAGHCAYFAAKKSLTNDEEIDTEREKQTGLLLASAAFCSGTAWQPLVGALQAADLSFAQVFAGTWIGCGTAFYLGLRTARTIFSGPCRFIEEPSYENSSTDKSLSMAIGGATGFFVGTDTAYLPTQNFLIHTVGIHEATPALTGCVIAGTSTSLGFS